MDVTSIPLLSALKSRMDHLQQKQQVIADNVANANTPGYAAREVAKQDFTELLQSVEGRGHANARRMDVTHENHFAKNGGAGAEPATGRVKDPSDVSPSGNSVVLEEQMIELANTQIEYGMTVSLYRKHLGILRAALGRRQS